MTDNEHTKTQAAKTQAAVSNLARAYVDASCAHDIERIRPMLAENIVYDSSNVGRFEGHVATLEMMAGFFESFPDVTWDVAGYRPVGELGVEFDFFMHGTNKDTGERTARRGLERIDFDAEARIVYISAESRSESR